LFTGGGSDEKSSGQDAICLRADLVWLVPWQDDAAVAETGRELGLLCWGLSGDCWAWRLRFSGPTFCRIQHLKRVLHSRIQCDFGSFTSQDPTPKWVLHSQDPTPTQVLHAAGARGILGAPSEPQKNI
jgi:hypothetical protein